MIPERQRRIVLARPLDGVPTEDDFRLEPAPVPPLTAGTFLARSIFLSLDPYLRSAIAGRHIGHAATSVGDVVPGRSVARVVASAHEAFRSGDLVLLETGWQEYVRSDGRAASRVDPALGPPSTALGVLGMPGLTAWSGMIGLAAARPGDVVVVSAAAGPVGATAGQLARIAGCRVVGVAGSDEKCALVTGTLGFDACVNYRQEGWGDALARAAGRPVDVYFDNVGGPVLDGVLGALAVGGRVVLCGLTAQYNTGVPLTVPLASIIKRRAHVMGLVVYDHEHRFPEYVARAAQWMREGRLRYLEDRVVGLEHAPGAFHRLMSGRNVGKSLVVVSPEDADA